MNSETNPKADKHDPRGSDPDHAAAAEASASSSAATDAPAAMGAASGGAIATAPRRPWWKRKRVALGVFCLLCAAVATLPMWIAPYVSRRVETELAAHFQGGVSISGLSFGWSGAWALEGLQVVGDDPVLSVSDARGKFSPAELFSGRLVGDFSVAQIALSVTPGDDRYSLDLLQQWVSNSGESNDADTGNAASSPGGAVDTGSDSEGRALQEWPFVGHGVIEEIAFVDNRTRAPIARCRVQIDRSASQQDISSEVIVLEPSGAKLTLQASPTAIAVPAVVGAAPCATLSLQLDSFDALSLLPPSVIARLSSEGFSWSPWKGSANIEWRGGLALSGQVRVQAGEVSCRVPLPGGERVARFEELTWTHTLGWDSASQRGTQRMQLTNGSQGLLATEFTELGGLAPAARVELALDSLDEWGTPLFGFREGLRWQGSWELLLSPKATPADAAEITGAIQLNPIRVEVFDSAGVAVAFEPPRIQGEWKLGGGVGSAAMALPTSVQWNAVRVSCPGVELEGSGRWDLGDGGEGELSAKVAGNALRDRLAPLFEPKSATVASLRSLPELLHCEATFDSRSRASLATPLSAHVEVKEWVLATTRIVESSVDLKVSLPRATANGWELSGSTTVNTLRAEIVAEDDAAASTPLTASSSFDFSIATDDSAEGLRVVAAVENGNLRLQKGDEEWQQQGLAINADARLRPDAAVDILTAQIRGAEFLATARGIIHLEGEKQGVLEGGKGHLEAQPQWLQQTLAPYVELEWVSDTPIEVEWQLAGALAEQHRGIVDDEVPWAPLIGTTGSTHISWGTVRLQNKGIETWLVASPEGGLPLQWSDGHLRVDGQLQVNDGPVDIDADIDLRGAGSPLVSAIEIDARNVRVNATVVDLLSRVHPLFAVRAPLDGFLDSRVDAQLDFDYAASLHSAWRAQSWQGLPKEPWSGKGHVEVHDFALKEAPLVTQLLSALKVEKPSGMTLNPVDFTVSRGRLSYDHPMQLKIDAHSTLWTGSIGLDQSLDLMWQIPITEEWAERRKELKNFIGQTLDIPVTGSSSSPQVNWSGVISQLASKGVESVVKKGLDDLLGLGGGEGKKSAADLLREADQLWDAGKQTEASLLYRELRDDHRTSLVYQLNQKRIKKRMAP